VNRVLQAFPVKQAGSAEGSCYPPRQIQGVRKEEHLARKAKKYAKSIKDEAFVKDFDNAQKQVKDLELGLKKLRKALDCLCHGNGNGDGGLPPKK